MFSVLYADKDYAKTFQLELKEGSFLSLMNSQLDNSVVVINEKAAEIMGFKNPIGEMIHQIKGFKFSYYWSSKRFSF